MLDTLFGSRGAENVLLYLQCYETGHAGAIARTFSTGASQVQKQLVKFEAGGLLVSRMTGTARVFGWNPRCPVLKEVRTLLQAALDLKSDDELQRHFRERRRPRRSGKPS